MNNAYNEFLGSSTWKTKRNNLINERGSTCEKCGKPMPRSKINIHHRHYDKEFGAESGEDLIVICNDCHKELHQGVESFENKEMAKLCTECNKPLVNNKYCACGIEIIKLGDSLR